MNFGLTGDEDASARQSVVDAAEKAAANLFSPRTTLAVNDLNRMHQSLDAFENFIDSLPSNSTSPVCKAEVEINRRVGNPKLLNLQCRAKCLLVQANPHLKHLRIQPQVRCKSKATF